MSAPPAAAIDVRRLTYADLPQVVAIERRAYPTPWSLAMFVLELSKAGGSALPRAGARQEAGRLPHLLALRHGLAHHERGRRPRPAPPRDRLDAADAAVRARRRPGGALHARGAALERGGDRAV